MRARTRSIPVLLVADSPEQLPIKHTLAKAFGVFNKMYTAVPSASSPNHLFTQSATSCGMKDNLLYDDCGGPTKTFPQMTIYDNLRMQCVHRARRARVSHGLRACACSPPRASLGLRASIARRLGVCSLGVPACAAT